MRNQVLAERYAKALFDLAQETAIQEVVLKELMAVVAGVSSSPPISKYFNSPVLPASQKLNALNECLKSVGVSSVLTQFLRVLLANDRWPLLQDILVAFQGINDRICGVKRGVVKTAGELGSEERRQVEKVVEEFTAHKVVLQYEQDLQLIGGLKAQVGSFVFDDSISGHFTRMNGHLKRRSL